MPVTHHVRIRREPVPDAERERLEPAAGLPAEAVLSLQRGHGNRAVAQLLGRQPTPTTAPPKPAAERFKDALAAKVWPETALALDELPDDQIQALVRPLKGQDLIDVKDAAQTLPTPANGRTDRVYRNIIYTLNPAAATIRGHPGEAVRKDVGDLRHSGRGVEVHTDVELEKQRGDRGKDWFSIGYKGADAGKTRWLQFVWREIEVHPARGAPFWLPGTLQTTGGNEYDLTQDPLKPLWNTDALKGAPTPFYEDSGGDNRTADSTTIFDRPDPGVEFAEKQFDPPVSAKRVFSRAHFQTYLVRDMELVERIELDVVWEFTSKRVPPRKIPRVVAQRGASALERGQKGRLEQQFPAFAYLP